MTGAELRTILDDNGIRYNWLAKQLLNQAGKKGISETSITKWMDDEMPISDERALEIRRVLNTRKRTIA